MHKLVTKGIVEVVKRRYEQGDHPIDPRPSGETLEEVILELATELEAVKAAYERLVIGSERIASNARTEFNVLYREQEARASA